MISLVYLAIFLTGQTVYDAMRPNHDFLDASWCHAQVTYRSGAQIRAIRVDNSHVEIDVELGGSSGLVDQPQRSKPQPVLIVASYDGGYEFAVARDTGPTRRTIPLSADFYRPGHHYINAYVRALDGVTLGGDGQCFITPAHATLSRPYGFPDH